MKKTTQTALIGVIILVSVEAMGYPEDGDGAEPAGQKSALTTQDPDDAKEQTVPKMEVVFALDTTGSMGGLIAGAKEKIWSIANSLAQAEPAPDIKMGLIAYRDRGDVYITKRTPLTEDLDAIYDDLMDYQAQGGGDTPESVNQALHEAVTKMKWSDDNTVYKAVFLVGDSPPKMGYRNDVKYPETCRLAANRGIIINTIQCGNNHDTTPIWKKIALNTNGVFNAVSQSGDTMVASTPYDKELAKLSEELDETRKYYGNADTKIKARQKKARSQKIHKKASNSAKARRATYTISKSGSKSHVGKSEIISDVSNGRVKLKDIKKEELPENMQAMSDVEKEEYIKKTTEKRKQLKKKMKTVSKKRSEYIQKEIAKRKDKGKKVLSQKIFDSVTEQAEKKNIRFKSKKATH